MNKSPLPVLTLKNIWLSYKSGDGQLDVLRGIDFTLNQGELVALVAPSGTGKSTLLHVAGMLESPQKGEVFLSGKNATQLNDYERTQMRLHYVGFVYQFHHLLVEFTAQENVMLPQLTAHVPKKQAAQNAKNWLEKFSLGQRLDHLPGKLSGGEQQRVAIARALANHPHVLLADEPTGNLDQKTSDHVFDLLLQVVRQEGLAALIATHNIELAKKMDRVITIEEGKVVPYNF